MKRKASRCTLGFERICPMEWDLLEPSDGAEKRHCTTCNLDVYWCESEAKALWHAARGHCIALQWDTRDLREPGPVGLIGRLKGTLSDD